MKALVQPRGGGDPTVVALPRPEPGPGEVLVRTTAALVCAWDGHTAPGAPRELGHEAVGVVEAAGPGVPESYLGRRVGVEEHGRLAEYFRAPVTGPGGVVPLPDSVTDHQALYAAGALAMGFAASEAAGPPAGGTLAVFGQGAVGLSATVAAGRLRGARVIAVEPDIRRQRLALRFGADVVVDPAYEDTAERLLELTGGAGADCSIVATPAAGATEAARRGTAEGGQVTYARCRPAPARGAEGNGAEGNGPDGGGPEGDGPEGDGPEGNGGRLALMLELIGDGLVDPTVMTTHEFTFTRVEEAYRRLASAEPGMIKPIILFPRRQAPLSGPGTGTRASRAA